jgi:hypothetical protein
MVKASSSRKRVTNGSKPFEGVAFRQRGQHSYRPAVIRHSNGFTSLDSSK